MAKTSGTKLNDDLLRAAMTGDDAALRALLAQGADPSHADADGATALELAALSDCFGCVRELAAHASQSQLDSALILCSYMGHLASAHSLLPRASAQASDGNGNTALMMAARSGNPDLAKALLPFSDPDRANNRGETALIIAAGAGHTACVDALLPSSDIFLRNKDGQTAEECAAGHAKSAELLRRRAMVFEERAEIGQCAAAGRPAPKAKL